MKSKLPISVFASLLLVYFHVSSHGAVLVHQYDLNGTYADALGGPALANDGGTLTASNYLFGANQGLSLSNGFGSGGAFDNAYSIVIDFSLDTTDGFRKIIDFKNLGSDNGLYNFGTQVNLYPLAGGPSGAIPTGTQVELTITRDSLGNVKAYVGQTLQFTTTDGGTLSVFDGVNNIARFFEDDNTTGHNEASAGQVDRILIYSGVLAANEIPPAANTTAAAPEPASLAIWACGVACAVVSSCRRRRQSAA
jgi:hypothetical protein